MESLRRALQNDGYDGFLGPVTEIRLQRAPNAPPRASVKADRGAAGARDRDLFERYVAAKKARGEDVSGYRLEGFLEGLERERRKVRERLGAADVVFDVAGSRAVRPSSVASQITPS